VRKTASLVVLVAACIMLCPASGFAQDNPDTPKPKEKVEWNPAWRASFFGGYSLVNDNQQTNGGFDAMLQIRATQPLSVGADYFSVGRAGSGVFVIGPEYKPFYRTRFEPFVSIRAGAARTESIDTITYPPPKGNVRFLGHHTSAALSVGGGFDFRLAKHLLLRQAADYVISNLFYGSTYPPQGSTSYTGYLNHLHATSGFVFRF